MRRKNLAATVTTMLCALLFIVIGSCFASFLYQRQIIKVLDPKIVAAEGMAVFDAKGDKAITTLKLSSMKLGLKPATGEEDVETGIPSTVAEKKGSEGQYAKFKVYAPSGATIVIKNIKIDSKEKEEDIKKERENIKVSIKEIKESTKSLSEDEVTLGSVSASDERQELTFFVWLSAKAGEVLKASTISFEIHLVMS